MLETERFKSLFFKNKKLSLKSLNLHQLKRQKRGKKEVVG